MRPKQNESTNRGFTLIELLVVIAIIGLLSSVVLASLATAREKAYYAKAASDMHTLQVGLQLYYNDHGDWPAPGEAFSANTANTPALWSTFIDYMHPYVSDLQVLGFPTIQSGNMFMQGYSYAKGSPENPLRFNTFNGATGQFVACITIRNGYWIDFLLPKQSSLTLNDGGIDPDGIEGFDGDYTIYTDQASCPP